MAKSDDAKRVRPMDDLLLNYDPMSGLEPGYPDPEAAYNAQVNPYFYAPRDEPEALPEEEEGPGPMSTRLALARLLMQGD